MAQTTFTVHTAKTKLATLLNNITLPDEGVATAHTETPTDALPHTQTSSSTSMASDSASEVLSEQPLKGAEVKGTNINTGADANNEKQQSLTGFSDSAQTYTTLGNIHHLQDNTSSSVINIKGRADGVLIELGRGSWTELMEQLSERLRQAAGFFRGGKVTLNVGLRSLQEDELRLVRNVLDQFGMTLGVVRSVSEQTCQAALAFGLAASLDAPDGLVAQPAASNHDTLQHFVYRGNLRSGQILRRRETVVVLGDVNPGAQVVSHGDILVWGRLRGIAHAGAVGDESSIIAALAMEPTQLRIAGLIAILPEEDPSLLEKWFSRRSATKRPEIAYITEQQIFVEPWDESKPGGIMAFRR
jgi:septum site-determining protein MinC